MFSLREMDRIERNLWGPYISASYDVFLDTDYDVVSDATGYTVYSVLPGMEAGDIDIVYEDGVLRIEGERKEASSHDKESSKLNKLREEIQIGRFKQEFRFSKAIDESTIKANYNKGILTVKVQKAHKGEALKIKAS